MKSKNLFLLFLSCLLFSCGGGSDNSIVPPIIDPIEDDYVTISAPTDLKASLAGQKVKISNHLYVTSVYGTSGKLENSVHLSSVVLRTPTDVYLPGSTDYINNVKYNQLDCLILSVPSSVVLADASTNSLRVGAEVSGLQGTLTHNLNTGVYTLTMDSKPTITANDRPSAPTTDGYNLKVASMNLEFYIASPSAWGKGYGADNEAQFTRQKAKVVAAIKELNADIYAICEIQEGNYSVNELTRAINDAFGLTAVYKYIDSGDTGSTSTYTKNVFIYNSTKVKTYKDFKITYDAGSLKLRHVAQCFELASNGERVILGMNHFKAKSSGSGANADQGDGQGKSNAARKEEATQCVSAYEVFKTFYEDPDVLVLGDLNSYSQEDPIKIFTNAGYTNELMKYSPYGWSYCYNNEVGYLDHSLSSPTLTTQVIKATPWDVNASEPVYFNYQYESYFQSNAYGYSDHNPIVTFLELK